MRMYGFGHVVASVSVPCHRISFEKVFDTYFTHQFYY